METLSEIFPVILYGLLIILVVVLIVLVIKLIRTLKRVDEVVDDVNGKVKSLNGLFAIIDKTADTLSDVGDKFVNVISNGIGNLFSFKKKKERKEEQDDE